MADEFVLGLVDQLAVFLVDEYVFRINDLAALVVQDDLVQGKGQGDVPVGIQFEIIVIHRLVIIERLLVQLVQFDVLIFIFQRSPVCGNFWFRHERMGFAVIKALQLVAADFLQEPGLFFRLHPFHQGVDTQVVGHFHNLFQDDRVLAVGAEAFQKLHIQLDQVKIKILQHVQGGKAGAEIVHPDLEACFVEAADLLLQVIVVDALYRFGDFQSEKPGRHAGGLYPF